MSRRRCPGPTGAVRTPRRAFIAASALGLCAASWLPSALAADEGPSLEELLAAFRKSRGLSARFVEEKHIALLDAPLKSSGALYFLPPHTLARHVLSPKRSVLLLEGTRLRVADDDGTRSVDLSQSPALAALVQSFAQVLRGDRTALEDYYRVEYRRPSQETSSSWRLRLTPHKAAVQRLIQHLELTGSGLTLASLTVEEPSGDRTVTRFSDVRPDRSFSDAEKRRFFRLPER